MQSDLVIAKLFHDLNPKQCGTWLGASPAHTHLLSNDVNHVSRSPVFWFMLRRYKGYSLPLKIVSEYDQEIPQLQTVDNPMAPQGRVTQPSRYTRKTN